MTVINNILIQYLPKDIANIVDEYFQNDGGEIYNTIYGTQNAFSKCSKILKTFFNFANEQIFHEYNTDDFSEIFNGIMYALTVKNEKEDYMRSINYQPFYNFCLYSQEGGNFYEIYEKEIEDLVDEAIFICGDERERRSISKRQKSKGK